MYNFDKVIDRRDSDSVKWEVRENELPMWVADMDFEAAPPILKALGRKLSHGIFGYNTLPQAWYDAYIDWWQHRHNFTMEQDWLGFCTGVMPSISSAIRRLAAPNENVVIQTPVYNAFFNSIRNRGCRILENPLIYDEKEHTYAMDLQDLERKLADPQTSMMILCNPHNPAGKIWDRESLAEVGKLAKRHHVTVISDEIHCDITRPGKRYLPFAAVNEDCRDVSITCLAPTKAFNIPGIQTAAVCIPDPFLRHKVKEAMHTDAVSEPNSFACAAAIAAFREGEEWLDEMCAYTFANRNLAEEFIEEEIPELSCVRGDATYLLWVDIGKRSHHSKDFAAILRRTTGLYVNHGEMYGTGGERFLRINLACPRTLCLDGLQRLRKCVREIGSL